MIVKTRKVCIKKRINIGIISTLRQSNFKKVSTHQQEGQNSDNRRVISDYKIEMSPALVLLCMAIILSTYYINKKYVLYLLINKVLSSFVEFFPFLNENGDFYD